MTLRAKTLVAAVSLMWAAGARVQAGDGVFRQGGVESGNGGASLPVAVPSTIDPAIMEYYRISSNGLVEYAFPPPELMTPGGPGLPRPAYVVASSFLRVNAVSLGINQDPADFAYVSTLRACDGSERVSFQQTFRSLPVESATLVFEVQAQRVRHVVARFIGDTTMLPVCDVVQRPGAALSYLPQTGGNIVIATSIEGVVGGGHLGQTTYRNACTDQVIGQTYVVR